MKKITFIVAIVVSWNAAWAQKNLTLWYNKPAQKWVEALPLGNGRLGAMVFGRTDEELIQLNEGSLWSGGPVKANANPGAFQNLQPLREALFTEDYITAEALSRKMQGDFSESYLPLGDLLIRQDFGKKEPLAYYRDLSLNNAVATTRFVIDGVTYSREIFISTPANLLVIKLSSSKTGALVFDLKLKSLLARSVSALAKDHFVLDGKASDRAAQGNYNQKGRQDIQLTDTACSGMRFRIDLRAKLKDGTISTDTSGIHVKGATEVILYLAAATSFNGFNKCPDTEGKNEKAITDSLMNRGLGQSYEQLKSTHESDYRHYFDRVSLNLDTDQSSQAMDTKPWDERLKAYSAGGRDPKLEQLYYQYGRYLLISSSRPGGAPANLQGLWNKELRAPWRSNYTININTEMNYWLAEQTNLSEMHAPLLNWIAELAQTGKVTAGEYYHARGWVAHHNSDIWGLSNAVGNKGGAPNWANWYMGGNWLCQHLWEHYLFTGDRTFLKEKAYPVMKEAALFTLDWLVKKDGFWVTAPSTSPENQFLFNGKAYGVTVASTMDMSICWDLFSNLIEASRVLGIDADFRGELIEKRSKLFPLRIGSKGQLLEWSKDYKEAAPHHRHVSQLFGLHPGHQISPLTTPELAQACKTSLELRGDEGTGWSKAWKINFWARLFDGDHAYKMIRDILRFTDGEAGVVGGGTYANFFDAHPPFQIDGNFGATAGMTEMLLQSQTGQIFLLPSLPGAWQNGEVKGLKARNGFEVNIKWANGKIVTADIKSLIGQKCTIRSLIPLYGKGIRVKKEADDHGYIMSFETERGKSYHFSAF
ncbi:MAG: glycoside hydrolase family 95 protein [Mucilaginibacter sp.]|uniref:glycoside hydrolase family 95 protein n=1 Tax=Mucilaginibacter sp. TaxID=1882438 RepID=UPI0032662FC4